MFLRERFLHAFRPLKSSFLSVSDKIAGTNGYN